MNKIEIFRPKVEAHPDNRLFRFSLAQALYEDGQQGASIPHLERCIALQDDWMLPHILLGKALVEEGRPQEAERVLSRALELATAQQHDDPADELRQLLADLRA